MTFKNRTDAGKRLAAEIAKNRNVAQTSGVGASDLIVLGLPRGGVVVAFEIAKTLHAPLDVFVVRKIGVPGQGELAMGAVASGGAVIRNESVLQSLGISKNVFQDALHREQATLAENEATYRGVRKPLKLQGQSVILVDDGLATGASMKAAITGVKAQSPHHLIVAVPVAASQTCDEVRLLVDDLLCLSTPEPFYGVGQWYYDFRQTATEEVQAMLKQAELLCPMA